MLALGSGHTFMVPWARVSWDFLWEGGEIWGPRGGDRQQRVDLAGTTVFSLHRELLGAVFQSFTPVHDPYLPSPAPLFPLSRSVAGTWPMPERK
jgi:hypothetical protein